MIGYERIVITVAEKIGKTHLTYAQGAGGRGSGDVDYLYGEHAGSTRETYAYVLSSGVAGTMWANRSGVQAATLRKIGMAWILTLPASMTMAGLLFLVLRLLMGAE